MRLDNNKAIIYGAGGAIGAAVARAFAREGAKVFLTGRTLDAVEAVAKDISTNGGVAEAAQVDAMDAAAISEHAADVVARHGGIDISFNAIGLPQPGVQGTALVDLDLERFTAPIHTYLTSHFLTAQVAGRHMAQRGSGVIITLTAAPNRMAAPLIGGMGPSWAGVEALTRGLAAELGPRGVRVVCLRPDGIPETGTIDVVFGLHAQALGITTQEFTAMMAERTLLGRLPTLAEVAGAAVFLASSDAGAMTGTALNVSGGSLAD
ncbi:SDR family oxidoreductase [Actinoplanes sp. KI2]|uniref:SDR family NAD(P)-dependent oxidoreductase n=1 Tax=Actinoplanes sp. KI2 TaxID=2983315 RepID=UPI0021D5D07A|nr:SDR family oxidoreductase [Actinoplanes sp. KI2]MCU7727891.1 SDR family oxidoreductase [Actinoplanes sp. KI2]